MSNLEGETPEFDDFELPSDDILQGSDETLETDTSEELDLPDMSEGTLEPIGDEATPIAEEPMPDLDGGLAAFGATAATDAFEEPQGKSKKSRKKKEKKPKREKAAKGGPGLIGMITSTSPYVVLLGLSVVALAIAILCLVLEWKQYDFQRKPIGHHTAVQAGPPSIIATA